MKDDGTLDELNQKWFFDYQAGSEPTRREARPSAGCRRPAPNARARFPFWLLATILLGLLSLWLIVGERQLRASSSTRFARACSSRSGCRSSPSRSPPPSAWSSRSAAASRYRVVREVATFYVEIVRGIPVLVLLFYVAFVGAPQLVVALELVFAGPIEAGWMPAADRPQLRHDLAGHPRADDLLLGLPRRDLPRRHRGGADAARSRRRRRSASRAGRPSASSSCRRRSASSCRRSATTSSP